MTKEVSENLGNHSVLGKYLVGPYYTGPKLKPVPSTPALIGVIFQMFTFKLSLRNI